MAVFCTAPSTTVKTALTNRKTIYSLTDRSNKESAYNWLYRKMAWVTADVKSYHQNHSDASLNLPTGGGFGSNGLYTPSSTADATNSAGFFPKPHITEVSISNEGKLGSIKKAKISFKIYTLPDLATHQAFFDIGSEVTLKYGWSRGSVEYAGSDGFLVGKIFNFSYSIAIDGSFDCSTEIIGGSSTLLSGKIDSPVTEGKKSLQEAIRELESNKIKEDRLKAEELNKTAGLNIQYRFNNDAITNSLLGIINKYVLINQPSTPGVQNGIGVVQYSQAFIEKNIDQKEKESIKPESHVYISLERLVSLLPTIWDSNYAVPKDIPLIKIGDTGNTKMLVCNSEVTKWVTTTLKEFVSADPSQVLFPGYGVYEAGVTVFEFWDYANAFPAGDASKIMLNVDWVTKVLYDIGNSMDKSEFLDTGVNKFLDVIFNSIYNNSGRKIQLTTIDDPINPNHILIVDLNRIDESAAPYELTAVTQNSICRSVSLTSKLPSAMAAQAYVTNVNSYSTVDGRISDYIIKGSDPATETDKEKIQKSLNTLNLAKVSFSQSGISNDKVVSLQAALVDALSLTAFTSTEAPIIPIDFSATMDGIEGIVFGNTFTCNYLPPMYLSQKEKIAFTVTKVEHKISNNDWSTTISTACRLLPNKKDTISNTVSNTIQPTSNQNQGIFGSGTATVIDQGDY